MSKKVLLADDSVTIQKVISITLSGEDIDLTIVGDGKGLLSKAKEMRPDLLLIDISMPDKDGYQLCGEIKSNSALKGIPVLLLAGTFEPYDEEKGKRVGADDYIVKPFESQELIDKVNTLLAKAPSVMPSEAEEELEEFKVSEGVIEEAGAKAMFAEAKEETGEGMVEKKEAAEDRWDISDFFGIEEEALVEKGPSKEESKEEKGLEALLSEEIIEEPGIEALKEKPLEIKEEVESEAESEIGLLEEGLDLEWKEEAEPVEEIEAIEEIEEIEPLEEEIGEERIEERGLEAEREEILEKEMEGVQEVFEEPLEEVLEEPVERVEEVALPVVEKGLEVSPEAVEEAINAAVRDVVEEVAWEVVPELIESILREELKKIKEALVKGS